MNNISPKILVIGAGASGIAASTKLFEHGFRNVTVLEAENRIGGRINTVPFAANVVDMGAQWCHGETDNVVYQLAHPFKVFSSATTKYNDFEYRQSSGEIVDREIGDKLTRLAISIVECPKEEIKSYQGSLGHFIVNKFKHAIANDEYYSDVNPKIAQQFIEFFHKYENSIEASDTWFDTSAEGYTHYWDCEGDRLLNWKDRGYTTLLDILLKKYPDPSKCLPLDIQLNKKVEKILWNQGPDKSVTVRCVDGSALDADHVIVTVSLGVLKERHLEMFDPPVPSVKRRAIEGLTLGTVDKIFIEFPEPFWPKEWLGFSLLWTRDDLDDLQKTGADWLSDVFGFYVVDFQPNILCGWISGPNARRMEMASNEEVTKGVMWLLRKFIKSWTVPDPVRVLNSNWYSNSNFRGSYTYRSISTDLLRTGSSDLAQPLTNALGTPVLQFAGEASHEHYYSTVHGAVESGWREAKRIIDLYKTGQIERPCVTSPKIPHHQVLILGGGLSGFGAALTLSRSNLNFRILEAQACPGGRVKSVELKNYSSPDLNPSDEPEIVEAGAQWLHGRLNDLYRTCDSYKILSNVESEEGLGLFLREDGHVFNEYFVKKVDFVVGKILEECNEFARSSSCETPPSVEHFLRKKFEEFVQTLPTDEERIQARQLLDWHIRFQVIDNSCMSLEQLSSRTWGDYCFNGEDGQAHINLNSRGFKQFFDRAVEEIGSERLITQKEVVKIDWVDGRCLVECSDGSRFSADHIIVTFSLGVLKNTNFFRGNFKLSEKCQETIDRLGFETINKIFLKFDHPWWESSTDGFQFIWSDDGSYKTAGWIRHLTGFDVLRPGPSNTLLGWVGGSGCLEMEKISDLDIVDDCIETLSKFTGVDVPKPSKYYCSRWKINPFTRGSYGYPSNELDKSGIAKDFMLRPITKSGRIVDDTPSLLFAGEAYHPKYFSTAHGAFLTGIEQANKILNFHKLCKSENKLLNSKY